MLARLSWISDISIAASDKRAKLVGNPTWYRDGYWSCRDASTLYAPQQVKYRTLVKKAQRVALIDLVVKFLSQWQSTPWQYEGTARHQLRGHFIQMGHSWALADLEAAKIIETAFRKIGHAIRPTWQDGQPEITKTMGHCLQCGRDVNPKPGRSASVFFCESIVGRESCQDRYNRTRDQVFLASQTAAAQRVYKEAALAKIPAQECPACGITFQPTGYHQKLCSVKCSIAHSTELEPRPCTICGTVFRPLDRQKTGKFCSFECGLASRTKHPKKPCEHCGIAFKPAKPQRRFCGNVCYRAAEAVAKIKCEPA